MRAVFSFVVVLAILLLGGCATVGKKFDTTHVNDIENGKTTKVEARQWFGEPHQVTPLRDHPTGGVERWTYTYAHSTAGVSTTSEALVIDFDGNDVVCDHGYSKTE
jgi:outer membrane protein assembly factor BamE (lipoprotein component of BamABCDE complex)